MCYLGNGTVIAVNLISDLPIGVSYVVISLTLVYLVRASNGWRSRKFCAARRRFSRASFPRGR
jgi:hypothetical protein